jgi:putative ABC transport system substrate-binding protein
MKRRDFIALLGGAAAWPLTAHAEPPVIGYLSPSAADSDLLLPAFRQGLNAGGYVEGRNLELLFHYAKNQYNRLPSLADDLVSRRVSLIFAAGGFAANAAKEATETIPIVFEFAYDPVAGGLVARLNRPGGNITGVSRQVEASIAKGLQFLNELMPGASSIVILINPTNPGTAKGIRDAEDAARSSGLRLTVLQASNASEIEQAFSNVSQERSDGLLFDSSSVFINQTDQLIALAARYRVPAVYSWREAALAGGLMSYGASFDEVMRIAGDYAARILKGEKPGDMPVQLATRIELAINLKTAKALGLNVPHSILVRADEVIE